jgi:DnaJ-class molecular chaperone
MDYNEIMRLAQADGYREITCETCRGTGIAVKRDSNSTTANTIEDPCSFCEGSGRMWQYGTSVHQYNDRDLAKRFGLAP